jgi:hypothetical protein
MSVGRFRARVTRLASIGAVCAGAVVGMAMFSATPAFAYTNVCQDSTNVNSTPVYAAPSYSSRVEESVGYANAENSGGYQTVFCEYFNNTRENRWYMPVRTWWSNGAIGGYIWVQDLYWGHRHLCGNLFANVQAIPSAWCFVTNY